MEFQWSYFKSWKMMLWKCCTQHASKFGKLSSGHRTGEGQFSFQSQRKAMSKNAQTITQLCSTIGHDWAISLSLLTFMHWRGKWQSTPVFLPGESQGRRSLAGCHLWGRKELDTTERQNWTQQSTSWETLGWKKHKLESRLLGEISVTSDMEMTPPLWQKVKRN